MQRGPVSNAARDLELGLEQARSARGKSERRLSRAMRVRIRCVRVAEVAQNAARQRTCDPASEMLEAVARVVQELSLEGFETLLYVHRRVRRFNVDHAADCC